MVEQYLRCYVKHQQFDWADLLPFAEVAYNNAVHSSIGFTPFWVATGADFVPIPECPWEAPEELGLQEWVAWMQRVWEAVRGALRKSAMNYKHQADKKRSPQTPFHIGQQVYLSTKYLNLKVPCKKLAPKYIGPFPIVKVINPVTVQLQLPQLLGKTHPVLHCSLLHPVRTSQLRGAPSPPPPPVTMGGSSIMK